jgi:DNA segregation ATPase FtsK/SpoIIIE, S-DNA-T family
MESQLLNSQADKIEMVLAAHHAHARVLGGRLTPRTIQFHLAPAMNTKLGRINGLTEEVALALGVPNSRLTRSSGMLSLEIKRNDSKFVSLVKLSRQLGADPHLSRAISVPGTAILGLDSEGIPLLLRLSSPEVAHCLIAGTTGSGKTQLARTIIASLAVHQKPRDIQLALFDPKFHGLAPFAMSPHLLFPIVSDPIEICERLTYLVAEMERRDHDQITRPRIVIVVDELADMIETGGKQVESAITRLAQRGRGAGMSVIACTQKPTARAVGPLLKANFPVRLVGRVTSAEDARVAAGIGGTRAEKLMGCGDFLLINGGQVIRFQAAQARPEDLAQLLTLPS